MSDQNKQEKSQKIRDMGDLTERMGGEGKIQFTTSRTKLYKRSKTPEIILFLITIFISCLLEQYYAKGTTALLLGLFINLFYNIRSIPHDNIPMGSGYLPFIGHAMNALRVWDRFYDAEVDELLSISDPKRSYYSASMPFGKNYLFISDVKLIDYIFRLKFGDAEKGKEFHDIVEPLTGDGIFASDGKLWKHHRSTASKMFTLRSLKDYMFEIFNDSTDAFLDKITELNDRGEYINIYDMFHRLTLEAFTQAALGINLGVIKVAPAIPPFCKSFDFVNHQCTIRFYDQIWKLKNYFRIGAEGELKKHEEIINKKIQDIISKRKEQLSKPSKYDLTKDYDIISIFLQKDKNISDKELRDICANFILAGRDTTGQLLSWFCYEMCKDENKHIVNKIIEEIDEHIGDNDFSYQQVNKMEYLENALLECLRLRPSVPHLVRVAKTDILIPGTKHVIRKGDTIIVPCYAMGRMPTIWKEPLKFDPLRFNNSSFPPCKYPAFNIPPRLCLGKHVAIMEAKIAIVKLFRKYELIPDTNQKVDYIYSMTNQMKTGFRVRLKSR